MRINPIFFIRYIHISEDRHQKRNLRFSQNLLLHISMKPQNDSKGMERKDRMRNNNPEIKVLLDFTHL